MPSNFVKMETRRKRLAACLIFSICLLVLSIVFVSALGVHCFVSCNSIRSERTETK